MILKHITLACIIALSAACANLLLKHATHHPSWLPQNLPTLNLYFFLGAGFFFFSLVIYMIMLKEIPLYLAQSLIALQYVSVMLAARFILKEPLSLHDILGMVLICGGIILIARGARV